MLLPHCLTIAGSDPSGGAGIQGDLKTFAALGVHGMAVPTALTSQNSHQVRSVFPVPAKVVADQMACLLDDVHCDAAKTGMLANAEIVAAVASALRLYKVPALVVDPVMKASAGGELLDAKGIETLKKHLLPLATIVTPNVAEAAILAGIEITSDDDLHSAAKIIHSLGPQAVLITGGDFRPESDSVCDLLFDGNTFTELRNERIRTTHTHGTGCCLTAAICAYLAQKEPLHDAVDLARNFTRRAILSSYSIGAGPGPVNPLFSFPR